MDIAVVDVPLEQVDHQPAEQRGQDGSQEQYGQAADYALVLGAGVQDAEGKVHCPSRESHHGGLLTERRSFTKTPKPETDSQATAHEPAYKQPNNPASNDH